jgi:hypothetical protein
MGYRLRPCFLLCCVVGWPCTAAAEPPAKSAPAAAVSRELVIRPRADAAWNEQVEDARRVFQSAAAELWRFFPDRKLTPILVEPKGGPIVLHRRGPAGEYCVRLDTGNNRWAQHAYQFAHEFCHVLCNFAEREHRNEWFEESLCEMASLFALRRMSETWKTRPPYPNWKDYAPALAKYADERMEKAQLPAKTTLAKWFRQNADELHKSATLREKNTVVAVALLPLFEKQPEHWEAVSYLNTVEPREGQSFAAFLRQWRDAAPPKHRAFIRQIGRQFEIDL